MNSAIACVSGASGMVGSRIVQELLLKKYRVRVLSRKAYPAVPGVAAFRGDINDEPVLYDFMRDARMVFHCAAELRDESKMWAVNVTGTERVLKCAGSCGVKYFCYLSSVGVIGNTDLKLVDETTHCDPQNAYEKSKWAAEQLVARGMKGCKVVVLRPTDVIDEKKTGVLALPELGSFADVCKVFVKGGECAHIVHAEDVAHAAVYFIPYPLETPQCYIVSCDHEPLNTLAGAWALYKSYRGGDSNHPVSPVSHLPPVVPHLLRKMIRGRSIMGDVHYSAEKLLKTGFTFKLGFEGAVRRVALASGLFSRPEWKRGMSLDTANGGGPVER